MSELVPESKRCRSKAGGSRKVATRAATRYRYTVQANFNAVVVCLVKSVCRYTVIDAIQPLDTCNLLLCIVFVTLSVPAIYVRDMETGPSQLATQSEVL